MLQKEVAERIVSKENNKKYGRTSIMMQSFFNVKLKFNISNTVFRPMPEIKSSLLSITPRKNIDLDYNNLKVVVENAFKHRRKKLTHNLRNIIYDKKLDEVKDNRAEQLTVTQYQELSHFIIKK
jgi:16S rRNA (adenine1518-N6/adenine1519-N6)-dimethyltransferase